MKWQAIILDLGGVLLDVDYHASSRAFQALGVRDFDRLFSQYASSHLFEQLETGQVSPDEFYLELQKEVNVGTTVSQLRDAWNAMLGDFRPGSLAFLPLLKQHCPLYLLSNTNVIHWESFHAHYHRTVGEPAFDQYFTKAWYSHEIGLRKPYPETYRQLLDQEDLDPARTLFVDDSKNNIDGAVEAGLRTHWLQPNERIESLSIWGLT